MNKTPKGISTQHKSQENLLILLKEAQSRFGYLTQELLAELAQSLGISIGEVYGAATFYAFLSTETQGRNVIRVCKSLPCFLKNSQLIIDSVEQEIGIKPGQTSTDGKFTFQLTNCIGACDRAPAMMINNDVYGDLTPRRISAILKACE
jgi:NADH:ubiquinone oxidoreductase subunit E